MFGYGGKEGFLDLFNSLNGAVFYCLPGNHHSGLNQLHQFILLNKGGIDEFGRLSYQLNEEKKIYIVPNYFEIIICGQFIVLSHYPIRCHNKNNKFSWMLCSHVHGNVPDLLPTGNTGLILDCGIESLGGPTSFSDIRKIMNKKKVLIEDHHK